VAAGAIPLIKRRSDANVMTLPPHCRGVLLGLLCALGGTAHGDEPTRYIYHPPESALDKQYLYHWKILETVLERTKKTSAPGKGTGLGLPVVQRIVADHGGATQVSSQPGEGTAFHLFFPVCAAPAASGTLDPKLCGRGERVLFADDEAAMCETAGKILQLGNYLVTTHADPRHALDFFRAHPGEFDLVITDLAMPGLTGVDLAMEILQQRPHLPVLLTSGAFGCWTVEEARHLGIRSLLAKPFQLTTFLGTAQRALHDGDALAPLPLS